MNYTTALHLQLGLVDVMFVHILKFLQRRELLLENDPSLQFSRFSQLPQDTMIEEGCRGVKRIMDYEIMLVKQVRYMTGAGTNDIAATTLISFVVRRPDRNQCIGLRYGQPDSWKKQDQENVSDPVLKKLVDIASQKPERLTDAQAFEIIGAWVAHLRNLEKKNS